MSICTENEFVERRKHRRYEVENGSLVAFNHCTPKFGQIIDLSIGGLAFRYIENCEMKPVKEFSEIDILVPEEGFYLDRIPIKSLVDIEITTEIPLSDSTMWQHCVQFETMTQNQRSRLEFFINNYTKNKYEEHPPPYFVKNEKGKNVGITILELYFGNLWQLTLDRLDHYLDGYLLTIQHQGYKYKIYRGLEPFHRYYPALRMITS